MTWKLIIHLGLIALFVGAIPLIITAYKGNLQNLHRFVWLLIFLTFDLILFGAFTRLTDSGLGCPDWPGCYGHSNPLFAMEHIQEAEQQMPFGPVTVTKAWIEMLHRYFASGIGFLMLSFAVTTWLKRKEFGQHIFLWSLGLFFLVCLQGAFGAFTVTFKLQPLIVSIHLLLALCFIMGLTVLSGLTQQNSQILKPRSFIKAIPLLVIFIVFSQILLGAWVSTNYAVLACDGFPMCNEQWFPQMDFLNGFTWWRELGKTSSGDYLTIEALIAIHWTHRLGAMITTITLGSYLYYLAKVKKDGTINFQMEAQYWGRFVLFVFSVQILSGLSNVIFQWPMIAALIHTGGAAALIIGLTKLLLLSFQKPISK